MIIKRALFVKIQIYKIENQIPMKVFLLTMSVIVCFPILLTGQRMNPEDIVQKQLDAYNSRNLEVFLACYTEDVEVYNFRESEPMIRGIEACKKIYANVFDSSPELKATIDNRIILGNKVVDHEKVTGMKGVDLIEVVAIYEVKDNLIYRVTFIRKGR